MVEAKVDIRKLQLLNDRIAQVTDALNQVRLSVHGLAHTGVIGQPFASMPFGISQPQFGFPQQQFGYPQQQYGFPQQQFGSPQQVPYSWGQPMGQVTPGYPASLGGGAGAGFGQLQHTGAYGPYGQPAMAYAPFAQGLVGAVPPWAGSFGWAPSFGGGLSHSPELTEQRAIEQRVNDPNHILQTFPFCLA